MDLSFIDAILNVCRSPLDIVHIMIYLSVAMVAALIAFYKFDKDLYNFHVYEPYLRISSLAKKTSFVRNVKRTAKMLKFMCIII